MADLPSLSPLLGARVGMLCTTLTGMIATVQLVLAQRMKADGLPYFRFLGASTFLVGLLFLAAGAGTAKLSRNQIGWMLLRSLAGGGAVVAGLVAAVLGTQPGEIAALTSINVAVAAIFGHWTLHEPLRPVHWGAIVASMAGAVLIGRPEFLFHTERSGTQSPSLGIALALVSGVLLAFFYIFARKSMDTPTMALSCCTAFMGTVLYVMLSFVGIPTEAASGGFVELRWPTMVGSIALLTFVAMSDIGLGTCGAVLCPAAVSATVNTASAMTSGYLAQVLLRSAIPDSLATLGAVLMLLAVVIMAIPRAPQHGGEQGKQVDEVELEKADKVDGQGPELKDEKADKVEKADKAER